VLQTIHQHPHDGNGLVGVDTEIKKQLGVRGGHGVRSRQNPGVGIVDPGQADGALQALQQLQVEPGRFADLARRNEHPVVAHHAIGWQQQRSDRRANLLDAEAPAQEPRDVLRALDARLTLEAAEQPRPLDVDLCRH
jgi:hypothetical protein